MSPFSSGGIRMLEKTLEISMQHNLQQQFYICIFLCYVAVVLQHQSAKHWLQTARQNFTRSWQKNVNWRASCVFSCNRPSFYLRLYSYYSFSVKYVLFHKMKKMIDGIGYFFNILTYPNKKLTILSCFCQYFEILLYET